MLAFVLTLVSVTAGWTSALEPSRRPKDGNRANRPAKASPGATTTSTMQHQFRSAMASGELERAAGILNAARGALTQTKSTTISDEKARWLLFEAELELAKGHAEKAGLAAMRVTVFRPKSEFAAEGLYWTAQAYERMRRPTKAKELYQECLERKPLASSIREKSEARLAALNLRVRSK